jgi:hypothetical protein
MEEVDFSILYPRKLQDASNEVKLAYRLWLGRNLSAWELNCSGNQVQVLASRYLHPTKDISKLKQIWGDIQEAIPKVVPDPIPPPAPTPAPIPGPTKHSGQRIAEGVCPECHSTLFFEENCYHCPACGFAKC